LKQKATRNCSQCGSPLILVNEVTEVKEGSRFPQTSTTYRCSNDSCQAEKDKQTAKRLKILQDKEKADQKRLEDKQRLKKEA
jgi:hypothetical protein